MWAKPRAKRADIGSLHAVGYPVASKATRKARQLPAVWPMGNMTQESSRRQLQRKTAESRPLRAGESQRAPPISACSTGTANHNTAVTQAKGTSATTDRANRAATTPEPPPPAAARCPPAPTQPSISSRPKEASRRRVPRISTSHELAHRNDHRQEGPFQLALRTETPLRPRLAAPRRPPTARIRLQQR